jgi:hypothetical protein
MLRNLYLTNQLPVDTNAIKINILIYLLVGHEGRSGNAYRVVAFIVKVRLVEKRVKRKVGIVMVVKVMIQ